jgi:hypothetical protein
MAIKKTSKTLQEFIELVLMEDGENPLYNTFIQPFVDVGTTTAYGIEKMSAELQTVLMGFLFGLPTLFVPFLEYDYESFREEERERLEKIKKKYEKVFQANIDALRSNDAFGVAFLLAPQRVLAFQLAMKAPHYAIKAIDVLTGAISPPLARLTQALAEPASIGFHDPGGHSQGAWGGGGGGGGDFDGMYEAKNANISHQLITWLKSKEADKAFQQSKIATQMKKDGVDLIVQHVARFMQQNTYDGMRKFAKTDAGFSQIGQKLRQLNQSNQLPAENNHIVANAMIPKLKEEYKKFWIKQLQQLIRQYPEANEQLVAGIKQIQIMK